MLKSEYVIKILAAYIISSISSKLQFCVVRLKNKIKAKILFKYLAVEFCVYLKIFGFC